MANRFSSVFISLVFLFIIHQGASSRELVVTEPETGTDDLHRRTQTEELIFSPAVATYVSEKEPGKSHDDEREIIIDALPERYALLRFDSLPPLAAIEKIKLVLYCTNEARTGGGTVFRTTHTVQPGASWNSRHDRDGTGLTELGSIGKVYPGKTYVTDISRAVSQSILGNSLSLVILPDGNDGAYYSEDGIQLIIDLKGATPPHTPSSPLPQTTSIPPQTTTVPPETTTSVAAAGPGSIENELTFSPAVATFVSEKEPGKSFYGEGEIIIDGEPARHALLRFDNLPPLAAIQKIDLVLRCTNEARTGGGTVFRSTHPVQSGASWNSRPHRDGTGLIKLASIGRVYRGKTYVIDISRAVSVSASSNSLSLVILPDGNDGAYYSTSGIQLIIDLKGAGPPKTTPSSATPKTDPPPTSGYGNIGPFQLMMWFDAEYLWQDTTEQRSWCVECRRGEGKRKLKKKKSKSKGSSSSCETNDQVIINECDDDDRRQWWKWDGERIRSYTQQNLCWDYGYDYYYHLRNCGSSLYQTFGSGPSPSGFNANGNFEHHRFELYPKTKRNKCVTQEHHPRKGEKLKSQKCEKARKHKTSYWIASDPPRLSGHSLDD